MRTVLITIGFLLACAQSWAGTIYVKGDTSGTNDGTSWTNAFTGLQSALAVATSGDEIWVAKGTYKPTLGTDRTISFTMKDGVDLYGGFTGIETSLDKRNFNSNQTILSADIGTVDEINDNSYHVVQGASNATIDGFIIEKGNALESPTFFSGGGIWFQNINSLIIKNCIFKNNKAVNGGAICGVNQIGILIYNCLFSNNASRDSGGGFYSDSGTTIIESCTFYGNSHSFLGGAICQAVSNACTVKNSIVWGNTSPPIQTHLSGKMDVSYSDVQAGYTGTGNINSDPLFVDSANGNFNIQAGSPCIDTGDPASPLDPDGSRADMGYKNMTNWGFYFLDDSGSLYVLDPSTKQEKFVGATGFANAQYFQCTGMDSDSNGDIWIIVGGLDLRKYIYKIDTANGKATLVKELTGDMSDTLHSKRLSFAPNGDCYCYGEVSGMAQGHLQKVDISNGTVTNIGSETSGLPSILGIEFAPDGTLWASEEYYQKFYHLDPATGKYNWTAPQATQYNDLLDIDFAPDGNLYCLAGDDQLNPPRYLLRIDQSTGAATLVHTFKTSFWTWALASAPIKPNTGLVAYYPFNGNANDESGNGNNGTVNGAILTTDRFGNANSAYEFTGIQNQYIKVPNSSSFDFSNKCSFSAWLKPTSSQESIIFNKFTNGKEDKVLAYQQETFLSYIFPNVAQVTSTTILELGKWYQATCVYDGASYKMYVNGTLEATLPSSGNIGNSTGALFFGLDIDRWPNGGSLNGIIDDVRFYNRALSAEEVAALYGGANLTMAVSPAEAGTTVPTIGTSIVKKGETFTITATPAIGYRFVNWMATENATIAYVSSASTSATLVGDATITANFAATTTNALLMMAISPDLSGSTTPTAGTISTVPTETELPITATAETGYTFVNWTAYPPANANFANSNLAVTSVTLTATATITANFTKDNAITVTSPNGGEKWQAGTTQTITWTSAGIEGAIRIDLYKSGKLDSAITTETLNDGSYSWEIPIISEQLSVIGYQLKNKSGAKPPQSKDGNAVEESRAVIPGRQQEVGQECPTYSKTITTGSFYKIRVSSATDTSIYNESANYFSISDSAASIAVTAPVSGSTLELGSATNITWTSGGITGNLKIDLYKGGVFIVNLSASETDDGTYAWTPEISEQLSVNSYQQENKNNMGVQESRAVILGRQENGGLNSIQPRSSTRLRKETTAWYETRPSKGIVPGTNYTIKITSLDDTNVSGSSGQFALTSSGSTATLTMALSPVEGGIITPPAGTSTVNTNQALTITADANDNYTFLRWSATPTANASITNPNAPVTTVTLTGDATVTALFSSTGGGYAAFDASSKVKITVDSAKQSKDSISIMKGKLPSGFAKPVEGDSVSIMVDEWSLPVNAGYKASGDGNKITYKGETVANGLKTNKYQLALDFKKLEWNLRVASADLSTGSSVDSFDGLDVMLNVNGTLLGQNIETDDTVKWRFSSEKNISEQLDLTGEEWLNFAVDKADGSKINYKPSKDAFNVGSGAGDIIVFDSAADSVIVSIDGYEVALDDADDGGAWKSGNGRHTFKGTFGGVTVVQFVLDLSKETASWKFKVSKADFWDDVDGSDGLDFRVIIGGYEGGLQLGADQITTMSYPQK